MIRVLTTWMLDMQKVQLLIFSNVSIKSLDSMEKVPMPDLAIVFFLNLNSFSEHQVWTPV